MRAAVHKGEIMAQIELSHVSKEYLVAKKEKGLRGHQFFHRTGRNRGVYRPQRRRQEYHAQNDVRDYDAHRG